MQNKFEIGEILEVCDRIHGHDFPIGEKVRVRSLLNDGSIDSCEYLDKHDYWFVGEDEVRYVTEEVKP